MAALRAMRALISFRGGGGPSLPTNALLLEDGTPLLLEDGTYLLMES